MGHALDNTMQDILIRYKKMQGYNALWQPGVDHAAIATESKVVAKLKSEGINKYEVIDIETGEAVQKMEYDNFVRYPIPKEKLGKHKLKAVDGSLEEIVLDYQVQFVGGNLTKEQVSIEDLIIK